MYRLPLAHLVQIPKPYLPAIAHTAGPHVLRAHVMAAAAALPSRQVVRVEAVRS